VSIALKNLRVGQRARDLHLSLRRASTATRAPCARTSRATWSRVLITHLGTHVVVDVGARNFADIASAENAMGRHALADP
jgi:hypothetical protein